MTTQIEHVNLTVTDADRTAAMLVDLFGWTIRWKGEAKLGGYSVHVGGPEVGDDYLAIYTPPSPSGDSAPSLAVGGLNHIGLVVEDLDDMDERVKAAGYKTYNHGSYEPGRRFYFDDDDGVEFEVVSYSSPVQSS